MSRSLREDINSLGNDVNEQRRAYAELITDKKTVISLMQYCKGKDVGTVVLDHLNKSEPVKYQPIVEASWKNEQNGDVIVSPSDFNKGLFEVLFPGVNVEVVDVEEPLTLVANESGLVSVELQPIKQLWDLKSVEFEKLGQRAHQLPHLRVVPVESI